MLVMALTGGIACGKSTVAEMLANLGACVVDADAISRSLTAPGGAALPAIRQAFGDGVFRPDGTLDRAALAGAVFGRPPAVERLNAIMHPMIRREMQNQLENSRKRGVRIVVLDVPLLFEAGMEDMADLVVCAVSPQNVQMARMASRSGYTAQEAMNRIRSQMPVAQKAARSDVVIDTNVPLDRLRCQVQQLYQGLLTRKEHA